MVALHTTERKVLRRKSTYNLKFSCWRYLKIFSELILFLPIWIYKAMAVVPRIIFL
jgi:hypothetical protein